MERKNSSLICFDNLILDKETFLFPEYRLSYVQGEHANRQLYASLSTVYTKNTSTRYRQHAYHQPLTVVFLEEISTVTTLGPDSKKRGTNQQFCTIWTYRNCTSTSQWIYDQEKVEGYLWDNWLYFHINSPYYYNLHKLANILVIGEEGKVMDYLAQRWSFWEGKPKSCTILRKVEANQTNEGRSLSSGAPVSMLFPGASPYTCSTK